MPDGPAILCVGAAHWDIIARASVEMGPGSDVPGRVVRRPGGVAANVAMGLARRGCSVQLCAVIGTDMAGDQLLRHLTAEGVECEPVQAPSTTTDTYVAIEDADGELIAAIAENPHWNEMEEVFLRVAQSKLPGCSELFLDATLPRDVIMELATQAAGQGIEMTFTARKSPTFRSR